MVPNGAVEQNDNLIDGPVELLLNFAVSHPIVLVHYTDYRASVCLLQNIVLNFFNCSPISPIHDLVLDHPDLINQHILSFTVICFLEGRVQLKSLA